MKTLNLKLYKMKKKKFFNTLNQHHVEFNKNNSMKLDPTYILI